MTGYTCNFENVCSLCSFIKRTMARRRSCANDLCNFNLREFHQPIKMLHTSNF